MQKLTLSNNKLNFIAKSHKTAIKVFSLYSNTSVEIQAMKTLFLLLIIYNLQNFVSSQNESPITYKKFPKKVHPPQDNIKLINTGAIYKPYGKHKPEAMFRPVMRQPKVVQPLESPYFPIEFFGDLKSRIKRVPYFDDVKRSKRDVNNSGPVEATVISARVTEKPKAEDVPKTQKVPKSEVNPKAEQPKPKENKPAAVASPKNASLSRRNDGKVSRTGKTRTKSDASSKKIVKPSQKLAKQRFQKLAKRVGAQKSQHRHSVPHLGERPGKKHASQKRALRQNKRQRLRSGHQARKRKSGGKHHKAKPIARSKSSKHKAPESRRLISARDARPSDFPYVVSIQKHGQHWCAGAILNPRLIITTANCFWKSTAISRMKVRAGAQSIDHGGQVAYIAEVMKHPHWSIRRDPDHDLALALLDRPFKFSDAVHGVDLPNKVMTPAFDDAWVTSYGADRRDGIFDRRRLTLQVFYAKLMNEDQCANITARFNVLLTDNFVCLRQAGRRAPCTRDTGAPAVSDGILWGLASWGIRKLCGTERFPAMFSYVASPDNMEFIINATAALMSDERVEPYLDRVLPGLYLKESGLRTQGMNVPILKNEKVK